jgi:alpha-1,2-rhamnosyltransferase
LRHAEYGRRLFWLDNASDADLFHLYPRARALVFPSFVEGFGMPLVEALRHGARVIASDIPVFREIGRDDVAYFDLLDAGSLAARIREALSSDHVAARRPEVIGWAESAATLTRLIQRDAYQLRPATQLLDETGERDCA